LAACSTVPTAGPTTSEVIDQAKQQGQGRFDFVEIDPQVVATLASQPIETFHTRFEDLGKPPSPTIGVGDVLSVAIWQSSTAGGAVLQAAPTDITGTGGGGGGLRNVVIPDQVVAPDGAISVPYAGRVPAAGRSPFEVQRTIEQRLAERAIEPQVVVTVLKSESKMVTVSGEDMTGTRVPLSIRPARLLDVIAAAGGSKSPLYETNVRLTRNGTTAIVPMRTVVSDPSENIYVWPGDAITVFRAPQTFSVFGATTNNVQIPFGADQINLAQAIAKAGGLQDARADPEGVFLFRFEPPQLVQSLGAAALATNGPSPVLYHLNLRQVASYFLAKRIALRDDDMIYVANAPMTDLQKFFTLIGTISGPIIGGVVIGKAH
jgi:polysaccharide export outer membrane protein